MTDPTVTPPIRSGEFPAGVISGVGGIVVCGGHSSRMGRSKAWLEIGPETFLQRVVRVLSTEVAPVVVVAAKGQDLPDCGEGVLIVHDEYDGKGPLAGLATGLAALRGKCEAAYASSTDVPLLRPEFVRAVVASLADADVAMPREGKFWHPLAACYRIGVEPVVRNLVEQDRLRPVFLLEHGRSRDVDIEELRAVDPSLDSLVNCNTPAEYEQLLARWADAGCY